MDRSEKLNAPGVEMISVEGGYKVWTQRVGDGPIELLTLHGGPGATHEHFESFTDYFSQKGIQVIYYDQLGSYYSDQPDDESLWRVNRFREEVEQVRRALGLESYYILGRHFTRSISVDSHHGRMRWYGRSSTWRNPFTTPCKGPMSLS